MFLLTETGAFWKRSPDQTVDFFNRPGIFWSRVDRGERSFSKTMTSNVVDKQKRFKNATCVDTDFLENGEKNLHFQKYLDTCGPAKTILKRYVWTRIFSKTGEKKLRF